MEQNVCPYIPIILKLYFENVSENIIMDVKQDF